MRETTMIEARLTYELGTWTWNSPRTMEGGATFVPAGQLSGWWAHALDPSRPIAWECDDMDGPEVFAACFGDEWVEKARATLAGGEECHAPHLKPPALAPHFTRVVVVRSLSQWDPRPIDIAALRVDEALAWDAAGDEVRAAAGIVVGASALSAISHALISARRGESMAVIPHFAHPDIERALHLALRLLPEQDEDRAVLAELADAIDPSLERDGGLAAQAEQWLAGLAAPAGSLALVAGAQRAKIELLPLDPASVSPRIAAWRGPFGTELAATREGDTLTVSIELADGVDPEDREVRDLIAFSCDPDTGDILERAAMVVRHANVVSAQLASPADRALAIGVFELSRADALRTNPLGRYLARLDRLGIGLLTALRTRALTKTVGGGNPQAQANHDAAEALAKECRASGKALIAQVVHGDELLKGDDVAVLTSRYRHLLDREDNDTAAVTLTIAEAMLLVAPTAPAA